MAEAVAPTTKADNVKECHNCRIYGWKQPDDRSSLKTCGKCQVFLYCDKECQKEHWLNQHKNHCKYLEVPTKKVLSNAMHVEANCLICIEELRTGKKNMSKLDNTVLPCHLSIANKNLMNIRNGEMYLCDHMPALPLGEMSGVYHSKIDASLAIMIRILLKMKMTKNIIWCIEKPCLEELYANLLNYRGTVWWADLSTKPGSNPFRTFDHETDLKVLTAVKQIEMALLVRRREVDESLLRPWTTFKILLMFFLDSKFMLSSVIADRLGRTVLSEKFERIKMPFAKFLRLWESVLDTLNGGMVPFTTLVEVLCDGNHVQQCYECGEQVRVQEADLFFSAQPLFGIPVLMIGQGFYFSICGKETCLFSLLKDQFIRSRMSLLELYSRLSWEYSGEQCDYCDGFSQDMKSHRCAKCKTKVYCGVECLNKDTVHLRMCQSLKGYDRKKKQPGSSRREKGREEFFETNPDFRI